MIPIDFAVPLVTAGMTLSGGWVVSTRVADRWDRVKKRRELDVAAAHEFQRLYGEFFAVWKCWDTLQRYSAPFSATARDTSWECLDRAAAAEGALEALLARIASERQLSDRDIAALGGVRQAFQALRKAIRAGTNLDWRSSSDNHYEALKVLCAHVSTLLLTSSEPTHPSPAIAATNVQRITDNAHEGVWVSTARKLALMARTPSPSRTPRQIWSSRFASRGP
jgi:hypothetical protein